MIKSRMLETVSDEGKSEESNINQLNVVKVNKIVEKVNDC